MTCINVFGPKKTNIAKDKRGRHPRTILNLIGNQFGITSFFALKSKIFVEKQGYFLIDKLKYQPHSMARPQWTAMDHKSAAPKSSLEKEVLMDDTRLVRIKWENPANLDDVLDLNDDDNDSGLYQIYCHHVVFGLGSLVYIGKTINQTFGERFKQHEAWLKDENDIEIRVGRLFESDYKKDKEWKDWKDLVSNSEALLIYWHSPPYNSKNINTYNGQKLHIQNWGNRGSILPECTSEWSVPRPDDEKK